MARAQTAQGGGRHADSQGPAACGGRIPAALAEQAVDPPSYQPLSGCHRSFRAKRGGPPTGRAKPPARCSRAGAGHEFLRRWPQCSFTLKSELTADAQHRRAVAARQHSAGTASCAARARDRHLVGSFLCGKPPLVAEASRGLRSHVCHCAAAAGSTAAGGRSAAPISMPLPAGALPAPRGGARPIATARDPPPDAASEARAVTARGPGPTACLRFRSNLARTPLSTTLPVAGSRGAGAAGRELTANMT